MLSVNEFIGLIVPTAEYINRIIELELLNIIIVGRRLKMSEFKI